MRWFHGLAAYNKTVGISRYCPVETRVRAEIISGGAEIAASDKPIGAFGVVVDGSTHNAFCGDVWSKVKKGVRYTDNEVIHSFRCDHEDLPFSCLPEELEGQVHQWCADNPHYRHDYNEVFVSDCEILAVWCKEDASNGRYWQARSLALKLRVPFVHVTEKTRIGQWCGTVEQQFEKAA